MDFEYEEDKMGMTVTSGSCVLQKDPQNLIGISIGGGAPYCPCLYVVQIFDNTPASRDGTLAAGDEIVGVSNRTVKGRTKVEVAKLIQSIKGDVTINYNKLHADPKQGKSLDIVLKKAKHRVIENMSSSTADALGLSRAILCNDSLIKKLEELERTARMYKGFVELTKKMLRAFYDVSQTHKQFGDVFIEIGVRDPQPNASETFMKFGDSHRSLEKVAMTMVTTLKPMLNDLHTYLHKAIPDTRLTIQKYADRKFEYLSYCLKVKEMDDEECTYIALQEPLYRVETGNYEYRLVLRCRQLAREKFAKMRSDVLEKLELLDQKRVEHIVTQLQRFLSACLKYDQDCVELMEPHQNLFPIEVDLFRNNSIFERAEAANQSVASRPYADQDEDEDPVSLSPSRSDGESAAGEDIKLIDPE